MLPERIEINGNHAEAMKLAMADWAAPDPSFVAWVFSRLTETRGEHPLFTVESTKLYIASKDETISLDNGDWLVLYDTGSIWSASESEFESTPELTFHTNQGRPFERSIATVDEASAKPNGFSFSAALMHLKDGGRVAREGWNGKGMWLVLVHGTTEYGDGSKNNVEYSSWSNDAILDDLKLLPWIGMRTADGGFVPWFASQTDQLAEDWQIVN